MSKFLFFSSTIRTIQVNKRKLKDIKGLLPPFLIRNLAFSSLEGSSITHYIQWGSMDEQSDCWS